MFDFTINDCGDLIIDDTKRDIKKCQNANLIRQLALVRIKSVTKNWFNHNSLGANLESTLGTIVGNDAITYFKSLILNSLSDIIHQDNIFISASYSGTNILSQVFIKVGEKQTVLINVNIDVVGGVNVVYETNS